MYKDSTYKEKFTTLKEWTPEIVETIKRDLKQEHLKQDYLFIKKYLAGKNISKLTVEDLVEGYTAALEKEENGEKIAEFMANRWMLQCADIYGYFEKELQKINPDFDSIEEIEEPVAKKLVEGSVKEFGAVRTYIFTVINSVALPKSQFEELNKKSKSEKIERTEAKNKEEEMKSFEEMKRDFEQRLVRVEDKYEKKLDGLQRKYVKDTEMLKKQVATLQRKMNG